MEIRELKEYANKTPNRGTVEFKKKKKTLLSGLSYNFTLYLIVFAVAQPLHGVTIQEIVKREGPASVFIETFDGAGKPLKTGSGFIVSDDGKVITNYHVIDQAFRIKVHLPDGDKHEDITIQAHDLRRDFAILKLMAMDLPTVRLGNSKKVEVGEKVIAIGSPQGLFNTVTDGICSAIRDTGEGYKLIQLSAPISPGSSGGPLFNVNGEVIGITTASVVADKSQNLNFALPINYVTPYLQENDTISLESFRLKTQNRTTNLGHPTTTDPNGQRPVAQFIGVGYFWWKTHLSELYLYDDHFVLDTPEEKFNVKYSDVTKVGTGVTMFSIWTKDFKYAFDPNSFKGVPKRELNYFFKKIIFKDRKEDTVQHRNAKKKKGRF